MEKLIMKGVSKRAHKLLKNAYIRYRQQAVTLAKESTGGTLSEAEVLNIVYTFMEEHLSGLLDKAISKNELEMGQMSDSQKEDFKKNLTEFLFEVEREIKMQEERGEKIRIDSRFQRIQDKLTVWTSKVIFFILAPLIKRMGSKDSKQHPFHK